VTVVDTPLAINDAEFARACVEALLRGMRNREAALKG
jgi:hypothetical protein